MLLWGVSNVSRVFVVLGVHRSATSFLAKAFMDAGVAMVGSSIHYEDGGFVQLNKAIIQNAGGSWKSPPDVGALLESGQEHDAEIANLLKMRGVHEMWGWKDPRQVLTVRSFLPHLDSDDVYLVAIFRKPERVGASLARLRQTQDGTELAREYNRRIFEAVGEFVGI